ncbi:hypothetical protein ACIBKY_02215 [Nonomuraea sp. NPDC050394]|uniref:hypothetical protein n=1 Tax=Nonomuraea sp. NPDC050394 TaxID=3364363 RepID=UPI0037957549
MSYPPPPSYPPPTPIPSYTPSTAVPFHAGNPYASPTFGPPGTGPVVPASPPPAAEPFGAKVHRYLKKVGKIGLGLSPAIIISGGMIANEPGMAQAASNWKSGVAARLDDGIKQLLPQLISTSKDGWIARDREEFERVLWIFHREIGALRSTLGDVGGMIDEVAASYRSFWLRMANLGVAAVGLLIFAKRLQMLPNTMVAGMLLEKFVTLGVNATTAILTMTLSSTLKAAGEVMTTVLKKRHQFGYVTPGGDAAIDFKSITFDSGKYPSFKAPPKPGVLPDGHEKFDWIEPKQVPAPAGKP